MSIGDYEDVKALLGNWAEALRTKNADAIIGCQSATIRQFTLAPPLEESGNDRAGLQAWLDTWEGDLDFEITNTDLRVGGDIGWCSALAKLGGQKIDQGKQSFWFRLTVTFARENGRWLIVHTHESVPFAMDGQPLGVFDLEP